MRCCPAQIFLQNVPLSARLQTIGIPFLSLAETFQSSPRIYTGPGAGFDGKPTAQQTLYNPLSFSEYPISRGNRTMGIRASAAKSGRELYEDERNKRHQETTGVNDNGNGCRGNRFRALVYGVRGD
jgi:hypothetical protein